MTDIATQKAVARKAAFARRKAARSEVATAQAVQHLLEFMLPFKGRPLAGYIPIRTEIDPLPIMAAMAAFGSVCVPVIQGAGQALRFKQWMPGCTMQEGSFGAKIPSKGDWIRPELLIVPLVAFDRQAMRLGYGGGFYDRTLEDLRQQGPVLAIGFAFSGQMTDTLPLEPTDQPLDGVMTENGLIRPDGKTAMDISDLPA